MRGGKSGTTIYDHHTLWPGMYAGALGKSKRIISTSHFVTYSPIRVSFRSQGFSLWESFRITAARSSVRVRNRAPHVAMRHPTLTRSSCLLTCH